VERLASSFRQKIDALTEQWQRQALLRLELHDPQWEAVQRLLHLDGVAAERKPPESATSSTPKPPPPES
jgi:hypothetical protein